MPNWSFANAKDKFQGLLADPNQLQTNPWWNAGMGLLASRYDPNVNPFQAAAGGLATARENQKAEEDRQRIAQLRQELAALLRQQETELQTIRPPNIPRRSMPETELQPIQPPNVPRLNMGSPRGSTGYVDEMMQRMMWNSLGNR